MECDNQCPFFESCSFNETQGWFKTLPVSFDDSYLEDITLVKVTTIIINSNSTTNIKILRIKTFFN